MKKDRALPRLVRLFSQQPIHFCIQHLGKYFQLNIRHKTLTAFGGAKF